MFNYRQSCSSAWLFVVHDQSSIMSINRNVTTRCKYLETSPRPWSGRLCVATVGGYSLPTLSTLATVSVSGPWRPPGNFVGVVFPSFDAVSLNWFQNKVLFSCPYHACLQVRERGGGKLDKGRVLVDVIITVILNVRKANGRRRQKRKGIHDIANHYNLSQPRNRTQYSIHNLGEFSTSGPNARQW